MDYRIGQNRPFKSIDALPKLGGSDRVIFNSGETSFSDTHVDVYADAHFFTDGDKRHFIKSNRKQGAVIGLYRPGAKIERVNFDTRCPAIDIRADGCSVLKSTQIGKGGLVRFRDVNGAKLEHVEHQSNRRGDSFIYAGGHKKRNSNLDISHLVLVKGNEESTHGIRLHKTDNSKLRFIKIDGTEGRNPLNILDGTGNSIEDAEITGGICRFGPLGDGNGDDAEGWELLRQTGLVVKRLKILGGRLTLEAGLERAVISDSLFEYPGAPITVEGWYGPRPPPDCHFINCDFNCPDEVLTGFGQRYRVIRFTGCRKNGQAYTPPN